MSASELLVGLHSIAPSPGGPSVRQLIAAVDACVADRATFHADALASALQQLLQRWVARLHARVHRLTRCMWHDVACCVPRAAVVW